MRLEQLTAALAMGSTWKYLEGELDGAHAPRPGRQREIKLLMETAFEHALRENVPVYRFHHVSPARIWT